VHAVQFHPISRLFISRHLLLIALPLSIAAWGLAIHNTEIHMLFAALITVLLCGGVYLRWRRWGFAVSDEYVYIRKGLLGIDRYCLPVAKVQRVSLSQSYFMQRRGLKTIKIQLASGSYKIPLLPAQEADDIAHVLLYKVASEAKSWM
jgi:putative membrane protein